MRTEAQQQTIVEQLKNNEDQLQLLIDSVADYAIFSLDPGGRVTSWSRAAQRMKGYPAEEILGKHFSIFYTREDVERGKPNRVLEAAATYGRVEDTGWRLRRDGTLFWANVVLTALHDPNDGLIGFGKVTRNLSQRKWAEEESFAKIFNASPAALSITTVEDGRFVEVNEGFCRVLGYKREELIGQTATDLNLWPCMEDRNRLLSELHAKGSLREVEGFIRPKGGELRSIVASFELLELGSQSCILSALHDITENRKMEEELRQTNRRLTAWVGELEQRTTEITLLSEMANLLQSCLVPEEAFRVVAGYSEKLFPAESGALYTLDSSHRAVETRATWGELELAAPTFEADDCWALRRGRAHFMENNATGLLCNHLGSSVPSSYFCVPMIAKGEALGILHLQTRAGGAEMHGDVREHQAEAKQSLAVAVAEHIGLALANMRLHETLRMQSTRDSLTSLFNRRYMEESLDRELRRATRNQRPLSLILLDADRFKKFNDAFGHEAGDTILRELAHLLVANSRKDDIACRFGGEEFALVLPEASLEAACERASNLRKKVETRELHHAGRPMGKMTLSFGVAAYPEHGNTMEALLRAADTALYRAKAQGCNRVAVAEATKLLDDDARSSSSRTSDAK